MTRRSRLLALPAGIGLAFLLTTSVFGYVTVVPQTITVTPPVGTFNCNQSYNVTAKVLDQDGKSIKNVTVTFSFASSPSTQDTIQPSSDKTNRHGVAITSIKFACTLGDREIKATVAGVSGTAIVHVRIDSGQHVLGTTGTPGGTPTLPNTSTLPADASTDGTLSPAVPILAALLAASAILVRRLALARR